jgi:hypothetical protein
LNETEEDVASSSMRNTIFSALVPCAGLLFFAGCAVDASPAPAPDEILGVDSQELSLWKPCTAPVVKKADGTYAKLSDTGLYCDIAAGTRDITVRWYEPDNTLWADGAEKKRFLQLPPGTQIDTTDMDNWRFPVGTKVWKEFDLDGKRLETRLLEKRADGTWMMVAFAWNDAETDAFPAPAAGVPNAKGTPHDIPSTAQCLQCHRNASDTLLSVSALQLAKANPFGVTLLQLRLFNKMTVNPTHPIRYPGNHHDVKALGYLYANCSGCHRGAAAPAGLDLSTSVYDTDPKLTKAYLTSVNMPLTRWTGHGYTMRIVPGDPLASGVIARMSTRVPADQMPRIGTEVVHAEGVAVVSEWIEKMTPGP